MRTWVRILIYGAALCLLLSVGGALSHRFGLIGFQIASLLVLVAFGISVLISFSSVATIFISIVRKQPYGIYTMFVAFLICFVIAGYGAVLFNDASTHPPIHNVTTNIEDPPMFSDSVLGRRGLSSNPVEPDKFTVEMHRDSLADLKSLVVNTNQSLAYAAALELVEDRGWQIVNQVPEDGVIEATDTTFWFGFKDDIAIRIRSDDANGNSIIDVHSVSRMGGSDLGLNSERIRDLLDDLSEKLPSA